MPPMLIIADDQMGPEEIDIHEVKGLSIGTEIKGFGYVVFTKTPRSETKTRGSETSES